MTLERYNIVVAEGSTSPQVEHVRPPTKMVTAFDVDTQRLVFLRVVNVERLTPDEMDQLQCQAKELVLEQSPVFLRLEDFFREGKFFFYVHQYFSFQPIRSDDIDTQECLLRIADHLDAKRIAIHPLDFASFGQHKGTIKIIPPFTIFNLRESKQSNRANLLKLFSTVPVQRIERSRISTYERSETKKMSKLNQGTQKVLQKDRTLSSLYQKSSSKMAQSSARHSDLNYSAKRNKPESRRFNESRLQGGRIGLSKVGMAKPRLFEADKDDDYTVVEECMSIDQCGCFF